MNINSMNWYIHRFSLMSFEELGYRFMKTLPPLFVKLRNKKDLLKIPALSSKQCNWYTDYKEDKSFLSLFTKMFPQDDSLPESLLKHEFSFFSLDKKYFGEKIDWHYDYKNLKRAPVIPSRQINYRDDHLVGDIKYIWELNRHQHLTILAHYYYLTKKEAYKKEICDQIASWIEDNPYLKGVNWISALELGIRLISWSWIWTLIGDLDEKFKSRWIESIYLHCQFIEKNFSRFSSANNHLIGEAAGLFISSIVWPFIGKSDLWLKKSKDLLINEMSNQNFEDGVNKEQALAYQSFVLDFFLLSALLAEKNGMEFPHSYWSKIEHMIEYLASVMDKNGHTPNIGDSDDGFASLFSVPSRSFPYSSLITSGAIVFKRGDFKFKTKKMDIKNFWIFGVKGFETFNLLEEKKYNTVKAFKNGGYYIFCEEEDTMNEIKCILDTGPLGYLSLAAHGHSDALSFTLNYGGERFFIDPGTYAYHTQKEWRDYFKGTSAHNTITVDGENQSVSGGNFMWLTKTHSKVMEYECGSQTETVTAVHYGYTRLADPVTHQRKLSFDKKNRVIRLNDKIDCRKSHLIRIHFHFAQECELKKIRNSQWLIQNGTQKIILQIDEKFKTDEYQGYPQNTPGTNDLLYGWESLSFDRKNKTSTLVGTFKIEKVTEFITEIFFK